MKTLAGHSLAPLVAELDADSADPRYRLTLLRRAITRSEGD